MAPKSQSDFADMRPPSNVDDMDIARGRAIAQFNHVESELISLFSLGFDAFLGDANSHHRSRYAIRLFEIMSQQQRIKAAEEAVRSKAPACSPAFRKSLFTQIYDLTAIRNSLAHSVNQVTMGSDGRTRFFLVTHRGSVDEKSLWPAAIDEARVRMQFVYYLMCIVRYSALNHYPAWASLQTCQRILPQRVVYPPPSNHPLVGNVWTGPTSPPQSFQP